MIGRRRRAIGVLMLATGLVAGRAFAQSPPPGHEQHHPDAPSAPAPLPPEATRTPLAKPGPAAPAPAPAAPTAPSAPSMDMGHMMREMERMMGGPARKPLMSRLLEAERMSEAERASLRRDADQRVQQGLERLERAARDLTSARGSRDDAATARAVEALKEATDQWETATAVQGALSLPPAAASDTARRWFASKMNIELPTVVTTWPWGLTPVHLAVMIILAATAGGGVILYLYRIRHSLNLLARLTRGPQP